MIYLYEGFNGYFTLFIILSSEEKLKIFHWYPLDQVHVITHPMQQTKLENTNSPKRCCAKRHDNFILFLGPFHFISTSQNNLMGISKTDFLVGSNKWQNWKRQKKKPANITFSCMYLGEIAHTKISIQTLRYNEVSQNCAMYKCIYNVHRNSVYARDVYLN